MYKRQPSGLTRYTKTKGHFEDLLSSFTNTIEELSSSKDTCEVSASPTLRENFALCSHSTFKLSPHSFSNSTLISTPIKTSPSLSLFPILLSNTTFSIISPIFSPLLTFSLTTLFTLKHHHYYSKFSPHYNHHLF